MSAHFFALLARTIGPAEDRAEWLLIEQFFSERSEYAVKKFSTPQGPQVSSPKRRTNRS